MIPADRLSEVRRDESAHNAEERSMNPVGSLGPEWISFAITPAMKPMMIVHRILICGSMVSVEGGRIIHAWD
jgi:hypothetical protein